MRRLMVGVVAGLALVFATTASTAPLATVNVVITKTGFTPKTVTINQNDSVTWRNADAVNHQVVANGGQFASPIIGPGKTYTHAFRQGGTFRYHDALHPKLTGTVTVRGAPPQISLVASVAVVKYGTPVTLSGVVSNKRAGETVTLVQLPYGQTTKQVIATLQTTTGGAFSYTVTPQIYTQYQAQWPGKSESSVFVSVAPTIKMPAPSRTGYFHFYVLGPDVTTFAGHYVYLQRFTLLHQWVNIARLTLGSRSGRLISVNSIRRMIPRGRWSVRVLLPADQAGAGYLESGSGSQPVVRR
jgi:plastocyanin